MNCQTLLPFMVAPGAAASREVFNILFSFYLERSIENVFDGNIQIVEQGALEALGQGGQLFLRHLGQLPIGIEGVDLVELQPAFGWEIDLYRFILRVGQPIFPHAAAAIGFFFQAPVVFRRAGRKDLHNQVRRAMDAVGMDFVRVADYHEIRHEPVFLVQEQIHAVGEGGTFFPA